MKSLKQDYVGFHWSAFFEPRLPFTGITVKNKFMKNPSAPSPMFSCCLTLPPPPPLSSTAGDTSPHCPLHLSFFSDDP